MATAKADSFKSLFIHLAVIFLIVVLMVTLFFYVYLPVTTNHGESITVPNVVGMSFDEVEDFLEARDLRFEVNDSSYSAEHKPFSILKQYPAAGSKVKENRKIYLSLNSRTPPKVKMPKLEGISIRNGQMLLQSVGLELGEIKYVPDMFQNLILKQTHNGKDIAEGTYLPQGSKIDLEVGDGIGSQDIDDIPDVVGQAKEDAELILLGMGLKIGSLQYIEDSGQPAGTVIKQMPEAAPRKIKVGESIDLWIAKDKEDEDQKLDQ